LRKGERRWIRTLLDGSPGLRNNNIYDADGRRRRRRSEKAKPFWAV
jgi:hypothetical protein